MSPPVHPNEVHLSPRSPRGQRCDPGGRGTAQERRVQKELLRNGWALFPRCLENVHETDAMEGGQGS